MAGASTIVVLGLLFLTECHSAPVQCGEMVGRLQAEMEDLVRVINDQHRYIQGLHLSQAQKLPQIHQTHLQTGGQYKDCAEIFKDGNSVSGLYMIRPDQAPSSFMVFCDMSDGGGWTVVQRRKDGTESFDRAWVEYKHGFGDSESDGEFWLGNDPLHYLTSQGDYNLKINMEDFDGNQRFAKYKNMKVDDEKRSTTIVPSKLITNLRTLGLNISLCNWILDFLLGRPQVVRIVNITSTTLILNTGAPQGRSVTWQCGARKWLVEDAPIHIDGAVVEWVESFKFLCVHIAKELTWSIHTNTVLQKILKNFYSCTIEGILTGCITAWYGNCFAFDHKVLQRNQYRLHLGYTVQIQGTSPEPTPVPVGSNLDYCGECESGNLNGHYYNGPYQAVLDDGVVWYTWHGWWYSIKSVVMMIRASDVHLKSN
ncbi:fibrinogen-like protein 1 [Oncorhynchus masou masou]|uniref:fibrinogen-like protein 1 n=1 Tax=Oncorhynchus masou masou TaxID=90313 RepID=UPI003182E8A3